MKTPAQALGHPKRRQIYDAARLFIGEHGYSPSMDDLAQAVGLAKSTVREHLRLLRTAGVLTYDDAIPRTIRITAEISDASAA